MEKCTDPQITSPILWREKKNIFAKELYFSCIIFLSGIDRGSLGDRSGLSRGSLGDLSGISRGSIGIKNVFLFFFCPPSFLSFPLASSFDVFVSLFHQLLIRSFLPFFPSFTHTRARARAHARTHARTQTHTHTHTDIHSYLHTLTHAEHTHTQIYTHNYTH